MFRSCGMALARPARLARPAAPPGPPGGRGRAPPPAPQRPVLCRGLATYENLLKGCSPENKEDVARVLEIAERAAERWAVASTDFFYPPVVAEAMAAIKQMAGVAAFPWGGYEGAERCRLVCGHPDLIDALELAPAECEEVAAVECEGNFLFDAASHRDFLGSCLGTGIERGTVGDIAVLGEKGAQILTTPEIAGHLEQALLRVRSVPVTTRIVPLSDLRIPPKRTKEVRTTEASLRVDAVASSGFGMGRSKMADLVKAGDVRVNWIECKKAAAVVAEGDTISVTGKGRCEVKSVAETAKGRYAVVLVRYI